jgi:hypothetical protein
VSVKDELRPGLTPRREVLDFGYEQDEPPTHFEAFFEDMKTRTFTVACCVFAMLWVSSTRSFASGNGPTAMLVDVAVARPITLAATIIGSVLFVVSLPIALTSHSVDDTARVLVVAPAKDTFVRPLGDLDDFMSYY